MGLAASVPTSTGVYLFRASDGEILYVGKARNLRRRIGSHLRPGPGASSPPRAFVRRARSLEILVVAGERAALLLEARLIRAHRPRYNRRLKEGAAYPLLAVAVGPVPRILLTRGAVPAGAATFGPFPEAGPLRRALRTIRTLYVDHRAVLERRADPRAGARRMAGDLLEVLRGGAGRMPGRVEDAMRAAAKALDFERAAALRDALAATRLLAGDGAAGRTVPAWAPDVIARLMLDLPGPGAGP